MSLNSLNFLHRPGKTKESDNQNSPTVSLIGVAVFWRACKQRKAVFFQISPTDLETLYRHTILPIEENTELSGLSENYQEFSDFFSKNKIKQLPSYCNYDLSIQIEEKVKPPLGPIYSLSMLELQILHKFIEENLKLELIYLSCCLCSFLVLFVQRKNDFLYLCINYRELNRITQKDHYPIPLVSNLLDSSRKIREMLRHFWVLLISIVGLSTTTLRYHSLSLILLGRIQTGFGLTIVNQSLQD